MNIGNVNAIIIKACEALRRNKGFMVYFESSKEVEGDCFTLNRTLYKIRLKYPNGNLYVLTFAEECFTNPHKVPWGGCIKDDTWKLPLDAQIILTNAWYIYQEGTSPNGIVFRYPDGKLE